MLGYVFDLDFRVNCHVLVFNMKGKPKCMSFPKSHQAFKVGYYFLFFQVIK
jgi:hypothetical protein